MTNLVDLANSWALAIFGAILAAIGAVARVIFTNQTEINLLKQTLDSREKHRLEQDKRLDTQLTEIRTDIKSLMRQKKV